MLRAATRMYKNVESSSQRLKVLHRHSKPPKLCLLRCSSGDSVSIGNVSVPIRVANDPHRVPRLYLPLNKSASTLQHLKWMMQKDLLGQDIFLIGGPGPMRRRLAMMYLEMTQREAEYIALSRDTTEADLKQRREIKDGTAFYVDQCAVRAATQGRILILEGIDKAERNVLPVLNNLLENREMQLEDGRFLLRADTYDKLTKTHSVEEINAWKLVRVNEHFRVIALGLPVPRYQGNPLDPPLRSRFQARDIAPVSFKEQFDSLSSSNPELDSSAVSETLSFAHTIVQEEAEKLGIADFPLINMPHLTSLMAEFPDLRGEKAIERLYPHKLFLSEEGKKAVNSTLENFELAKSTRDNSSLAVKSVEKSTEAGQAHVTFSQGHLLKVACGCGELSSPDPHYVATPSHESMIAELMQSHSSHDFCIIGSKGCGKSTVVRQFASILGYKTEPILLYQDMTSRDLLQQRTTLANGDTAWRPSPLIEAALSGNIAILDGLHRINNGTFSVISSLMTDRELHLADGSQLLRHDRFDQIMEETGLLQGELNNRGIQRIHPSFRIICLAEPPIVTSPTGQWLNAEILTMFLFHHMTPLPQAEEVKVIDTLTHKEADDRLFELSEKLRMSKDPSCQALAGSLSTRNLLRIALRLSMFKEESLYEAVHNACMSRFLPALAKQTLDQTMDSLDIKIPSKKIKDIEEATSCEVKDGVLRIGSTTCEVIPGVNQMKVPNTLFYDNPLHINVMESMLKDYLSGEHLLLVGNQGVGKNKVVDRFLQLLDRPREYIQLHRDTTVQTLTLQPTVRDGRIVYDDSPLVNAVREGLILVIDEADKAPTNVTCVLKTLVESGQMHLSDGRKIVCDISESDSDKIIKMHPDFRMFVLANRPGFPFLGNDFFAAVGDIFSCHALDNPDVESEISLLKQYGPDVPDHILNKLVQAFGELRKMADQGLISYPYSTREVVSIIKHLQLFPNDGLASVIANVLDFDLYNKEVKVTLTETMHKHGIPIGANPDNINLAKEYPLPELKLTGHWLVKSGLEGNRFTNLSVEEKTVRVKGPVQAAMLQFPVNRQAARSVSFSELESFWTLPLTHDNSHISDICTSTGSGGNASDLVHFATIHPVALYTMPVQGQNVSCIDLYDSFPTNLHRYRPSVEITSLGSSIPNTVLLHEQVDKGRHNI